MQQPVIEKDLTVYEYVLQNISLNHSETLDQKSYLADIILEKLCLDGEQYLSKLSGGQLRRVDLARTLVMEPDLLFLDEPTNHLDIGSIEWLEEYLNNFSGGLIIVSHDRAFLRNVSNKIIWLDRGKLLCNNRGFSDFERWSEEVFVQEERELSKLGKELDKENLWLQQGVTARRKRNQQRLQNLHDLRAKLKSDKSRFGNINNDIKLDSGALNNKSKLIVEMEDVSFSFPEQRPLFNSFSLSIIRGEVIGIMGRNGAGKSTFIKLITGGLMPSTGKIRLGHNLQYCYLDQSRSEINPEDTLWKTLCPNGGDTIFLGGNKPKHVVAYLKDFLFDGKQANSKVSTLSGGEQNRLLLAKLLINPGNFLILDEPTNDLDMDTLDMLVEILTEYKGTLLIVSHDRDFLERLATRTIIIDNQQVLDNVGGYYDYIASTKPSKEMKIAKESVKKEKSNNKLSYKDERELSLLPDKIDKLTQEIQLLEIELDNPELYARDPNYFNSLTNNIATKKEELEECELRWLELEELRAGL